MDGIARREIVKAAAAGAIGLPIGGAQSLLTANEAYAQGTPIRAWPNRQLLDLLKINHPIIQAPMGFHTSADMPIAVSNSGGLGSFPCAPLTPAQVRDVVAKIRAHSIKPLNLNFFCHVTQRDAELETAWLKRLASYYGELGVNPPAFPASTCPSFGAEMCDVVVELKPAVVSFHFGLPEKSLVDRVKAAGCAHIQFGDDSCRGALAGRARSRCGYCARRRGWGSSRDVLDNRASIATRYARPRAAVALDAGFGDLSYFNRTFRRRFGDTPSGVRAVVLAANEAPSVKVRK